MRALGLDIGGAHLKSATSDGHVASEAFPMWRAPGELETRLVSLLRAAGRVDSVAVTMTGELCDCWKSRAEGVRRIAEATARACTLGGAPTPAFWSLAGELAPIDTVIDRPLDFAASNWHALVTRIASLEPEARGVLVDIGSTTSDLIPFAGGRPSLPERDDAGRLASGALVYTGVARTPLCALVRAVEHDGLRRPLAAELFATTLDVYLLLGEAPESTDCELTADGRPASRDDAHRRLARALCLDSESLERADAAAIAGEIREAQLALLASAWERAIRTPGHDLDRVVVAGSGEHLARALTERVGVPRRAIRSLSELEGAKASVAACAWALAHLAVSASR